MYICVPHLLYPFICQWPSNTVYSQLEWLCRVRHQPLLTCSLCLTKTLTLFPLPNLKTFKDIKHVHYRQPSTSNYRRKEIKMLRITFIQIKAHTLLNTVSLLFADFFFF